MPNKLKHKLQPQPRVCEENKEKEFEEKNDCPLKYFAVNRSTLVGCRRTVILPIKLNFTTRIIHNIMLLSLYYIVTFV